MTDKRTLRERLNEVEIDDGLEGVIIACVTEWLQGKRQEEIDKYVPPILSVYDDLLKELASKNSKPTKGEE